MNSPAPVAVVTGASRGAGRGIAIALGSHGCTVYVTGRSEKAGDAPLPGTIYATAEAVTAAGGKGIAVRVDHSDFGQIEALFQQVESEQGRLDILVNNAFAVHDEMMLPVPFWEKRLDQVGMLDVGLYGTYAACWYAAPLLTRTPGSLVAFTSASGAAHYVFGPVYGVHKAGLDKLAADMAVDFRDYDVATVSIWMGTVLTERVQVLADIDPERFNALRENMETPEFSGHIIWAMHQDPERMANSGKAVIGAELALKYGIRDEGDRQPVSYRDLHGVWPIEQFDRIIR
ncbi:SDR family NAD(P)-dependent oxidoreductase [Haliea sp. E17]|uniref:SDR family NAD(P)-dependent oxidoreductase n=1 Tax=Haliea sp. E17 TaxID=3401576 RepID=UPI003AAF080F